MYSDEEDSGCIVRTATLNDVEYLVSLGAATQATHHAHYPHLFREPNRSALSAFFESQLDREDACLVVAEKDGDIVGYAFATAHDVESTPFTYERRTVVMEHLAVDALARGNGYGSSLIDAITAFSAERAASDVRLKVWSFNDAERLYQRKGFSPLTSELFLDL